VSGRTGREAEDRTNRLRLEFWPLGRLVPAVRNARTHSGAQVAETAGSIRAFGFTNPILVGEEGDVVAGHGRLAAARQLGLQEVPVIMLRGLIELQRRQLMLADNRSDGRLRDRDDLPFSDAFFGSLNSSLGHLTCEDEGPNPPA
jgi:hypothetical protein